MPELDRGNFDPAAQEYNMQAIADNPYPGRGIVLGVSADGTQAVETYWVMGRSENSRNRVLKNDGGVIKTDAFDPSKVQDPSLIIYNALRTAGAYSPDSAIDAHIVSNGDQTDTVAQQIVKPASGDDVYDSFRRALFTREFEPDAPNYTPRITGMITLGATFGRSPGRYDYSIINRAYNTGQAEHTFGSGSLDVIPNGGGLCFHTYEGDGNPLPSFDQSPFVIPVQVDAQETAEAFWDVLDADNRVALVTKTIDRDTGIVDYHIINALEEAA